MAGRGPVGDRHLDHPGRRPGRGRRQRADRHAARRSDRAGPGSIWPRLLGETGMSARLGAGHRHLDGGRGRHRPRTARCWPRRTVADRMAHVEQLTPLIADCVAAAGVDLADLAAIVVGLGPGPVHRPAGRHRQRPGAGRRPRRTAARRLQPRRARRPRTPSRAGSSWSPPMPAAARSTGPATRPTGVRIGDPQVGPPDERARPAGDRAGRRPLRRPVARACPGPRAIDAGVLAALAGRASPTPGTSRSICAGPTRPSRSAASRSCTTVGTAMTRSMHNPTISILAARPRRPATRS